MTFFSSLPLAAVSAVVVAMDSSSLVLWVFGRRTTVRVVARPD
jgi:hypothetical protein